MIYHEMMAVNNLHREYSGMKEITSEAINHHESSETFTKRKEKHIQKMMKYIEMRGSPFSVESPNQLHNFVTKEVKSCYKNGSSSVSTARQGKIPRIIYRKVS